MRLAHPVYPLCWCMLLVSPVRYLDDPEYRGIKAPRITGDAFDSFMSEVLESLKAWQPHMLLQFEDFGNNNAFRLLDTWRHKMCTFNDDIQVKQASLPYAGAGQESTTSHAPYCHVVPWLGICL